jgi:hypothetical protein
MGSCCSLVETRNKISLPLKPEKLYYLQRKTGRLFLIDGGKFIKLNLPRVKVNKSCAIGYLSDGNIIIAGGIRMNGRMSSDVLFINTVSLTVQEYPSLAKPCKAGSIHQIGFYIYYISSDLTEPHQKFVHHKWELINCESIDLHSSSVLVQNKMIYFLCGLKPNGKPTKKLYSLDIMQSSKYVLAKHKVNFKLYNPIAYSAYDFVIVGGGQNLDRTFNSNFFIQKNWEWVEIIGKNVELEDYPCVYENLTCFFFGKHRKIVSVDRFLKISVTTDPNFKPRSKTQDPKPKPKKYRKNSIYLQESLNNYTEPFKSIGSKDPLDSLHSSSEEIQDSSKTFQSFSQSLLPSPTTKSGSTSNFQIALHKITHNK